LFSTLREKGLLAKWHAESELSEQLLLFLDIANRSVGTMISVFVCFVFLVSFPQKKRFRSYGGLYEVSHYTHKSLTLKNRIGEAFITESVLFRT
jgi:hypothetical protein